MDNNIQLIDQRLAQLRSLIPVYNGQPSLERWLASEIINWQLRRNEYLHRQPTTIPRPTLNLVHPLVSCPHLIPSTTVLRPPSITISVPHLSQIPVIASVPRTAPISEQNSMPGILYDRQRQILNNYWQPGEPVGAPVSFFPPN